MKKIVKLLLTVFCIVTFISFAKAQDIYKDVTNNINAGVGQMQNKQQFQPTLISPIDNTNNKIKSSPVENLFNLDIMKPLVKESDISNEPLKQIGYDIFSNGIAQGFGKYDSTYVLSIGERVDVYFWGDSVDMLSISATPLLAPLTKSQIDGKGNLFVSGVGVVKAEGKTIGQVEKDIQSLASGKYTNVKTRITVADGTDFTVYVYGYVNKPGKVAINNNSSVIEALTAAGGVSKGGSLRNITCKSAGKTQSVDLYKMIFQGKSSTLRLKPNDTIFVNKIGSVIAIPNGVEVPGIYEISTFDTVTDVIDYAGGFLPSTNKKTVNIKAYDAKEGQRISIDIPSGLFSKTKITNGDILEFHSLYGKAEDFITLEGNVKHPAVFAYKKGMKLSDVLVNKNELQEETLVHQAVIKRMVGDGKQIVSIPISLQDFFNGGNNPTLQPRDVITVYKSTNSDFIEVYGCIDKPKRIPYNKNLTLKDVMADEKFIASAKPSGNIHNINTISSDNVIIPADNIAVEITNENNFDFNNIKKLKIKTIYLYDVLVQEDSLDDIVINAGDKVLFRTLRKDEIVKTVKISGYVKKPGVYGFVEGKKLSDMIEIAGGLANDANLKGIVFKRKVVAQREKEAILEKNEKDYKQLQGQMISDTNASKEDTESRQKALEGIKIESNEMIASNDNTVSNFADKDKPINLNKKQMGKISLDITCNDLAKIKDNQNLLIQDGDEIYIPKFSNHVMVIGEVYNETSFVYKENTNASYYIKMVGGFTPNARRTRLYKIGVNGRAQRLNLLASNNIEPGDTIIIPRKVRGNDWIQPLASTLQSIAALLTSVFVVTKL